MASPSPRLSGIRGIIARLRGRDLAAVEDNPSSRAGPACLRIVTAGGPQGDGPRGPYRRSDARQVGRAARQARQELAEGLKQKRAKLAADRFKQKNKDGNLRSKTEVALLRKLSKKGPAEPVPKEKEIFDVWGDSSLGGASKKVQKYRTFSAGNMSKVKAVINPEGGQSFNPSLTDHSKVLKQVVKEEEQEIEENYRGSLAHAVHSATALFDKDPTAADAAGGEENSEGAESSSDSDSDREELTNKAVRREKKLTKQQRNQKKERAERNKAQINEAKERRFAKQYDKIPQFIAEDIKDTKETAARIEARKREEEEERKRQEETGVVTKPLRIGRKTYKMRKTDFLLEEELVGSLRQLKSQGKDDNLRERLDSMFRRNLIDPVDHVHEAEQKRKQRNQFKIKARQGGIFGTATQKLDKKNKKKKAELDAAEKKQGFLNDDLILI